VPKGIDHHWFRWRYNDWNRCL